MLLLNLINSPMSSGGSESSSLCHFADPLSLSALLLSDGANNYIYGPGGLALEQIPIQTITFVASGSDQDSVGAQGSLQITLSQTPQANDQILLAIDEKAGQFSSVPTGYMQVPGSPYAGIERNRRSL